MRADWTGPISRRLAAYGSRLIQRATVRTRLASMSQLPRAYRESLERSAAMDLRKAVLCAVGAQVAGRWGL